jgi:hypothetical protein
MRLYFLASKFRRAGTHRALFTITHREAGDRSAQQTEHPMTSRLWPVLPILFAISERISKEKGACNELSLSEVGTMLRGCILLSMRAASSVIFSD